MPNSIIFAIFVMRFKRGPPEIPPSEVEEKLKTKNPEKMKQWKFFFKGFGIEIRIELLKL